MNVRAPTERAGDTRGRIREVNAGPSPLPNIKLGASGENIYLTDAVVTAIFTALVIEVISRALGTDL